MRKRRKSKYIWLPTLGADPNPAGTDLTESNGFSFSCNGSTTTANEPNTFALFPILEDTPQEAVVTSNPDPNIVDFIGTDYLIKRIVGKCFVTINQLNTNSFANYAVTAGFFVARADDQNALLPIGSTASTFDAETNYDPNYVDNIREPWIWRRTWVLSNQQSVITAVEKQFGNYPTNNAQYGSIQDGPHIDAKSARRVRNDERLWFACSCRGITSTNLDPAAPPNQANIVSGYLDIRVLGALRRARNRSNF